MNRRRRTPTNGDEGEDDLVAVALPAVQGVEEEEDSVNDYRYWEPSRSCTKWSCFWITSAIFMIIFLLPYQTHKRYTTAIESSSQPSDQSLVHAYEPWPITTPLPCIPATFNTSDNEPLKRTMEGFFLISLVKTGTATASLVQMRMAHQIARRLPNGVVTSPPGSKTAVSSSSCQVRSYHHWHARKVVTPGRRKALRFVWAMLREPTQRLLSWYWYDRVTSMSHTPSLEDLETFLATRFTKDALFNHYIARLSFNLPPWRASEQGSQLGWSYVQDIMQSYSFIGITERFDESLVVLGLLLRLPLSDILYIQMMNPAGTFEPQWDRECRYIRPLQVTPELAIYLESPAWQDRIRWDTLLYKYANESLDATIEAFGPKYVQRRVAKLQEAREMAHSMCGPTMYWPCSDTGEYRPPPNGTQATCSLVHDPSCGQECLDQVATKLLLWTD
jgi:hypothetical protein